MPESTGHGSTHTDRLHHHRQRVHQHRAQIDTETQAAAAGRYAPGSTHNPPATPLGPETENTDGNH